MSTEGAPFKPRILVAPLDWGLGHATRCIPVIRLLQQAGADVLLAGDGATAALLAAEFPQLPLLFLKGYRISYGKNGLALLGKMLLQIPKIIDAMDEEHNWLYGAVEKYQLNAVISDNRYGLYSERIPSVIITHRLLVKTGAGGKADSMLQKLHYGYIQSFNECWVPDTATSPSLGGDLSHPDVMPAIATRYVGPISRFGKIAAGEGKHLLILLSGPEPQRSILEQSLRDQLGAYKGPVVFIRGLPGSAEKMVIAPHVQVYNHLPAEALEGFIKDAGFVVARTGYSTVMDMLALQKKTVLIPTPGQTEQEYLAEHLMQNRFALCIQQSKFRLINALDLAASFNYELLHFPETAALPAAIHNLLDNIRKKPAAAAETLPPWQ